MKTTSSQKLKMLLSAIFVFSVFSVFSQPQKKELQSSNNPYNINDNLWNSYINKTAILLEKVDVQSFFNYVILTSGGNIADMDYFEVYVGQHLKKDFAVLHYKVGKGEIATEESVKLYLGSLQPAYKKYFAEFQKQRSQIIEAQNKNHKAPVPPPPNPQNCGSPCTNPGFESGNSFWDFWAGDPSIALDPTNLTAGFNPAPPACGFGGFGGSPNPTQHLITTAGGFDPKVGGTILPVVPPGGGNSALQLGDQVAWQSCSWGAARASISFNVSANNANFTYRYAVVLADPGSHTDPERPYFRVKLLDASGDTIPCGQYFVMAKPPYSGFSPTIADPSIYYRPWTTVFVPLQAYIGQCVTMVFTTSDCVPGGHFGYAYIDCACEQLSVVSSSPNVCGGTTVTLTAPAGGASYVWSDSLGGTAGIVGSTTNQTCVVNQAGTYKVVIASVTGATCTTDLYITIGSNPSNPIALFTAPVVCAGSPMHFTDASTPTGVINSWKWDFNVDGVADDSIQNPTHTFATTGTYPVALTITWGSCVATDTQNVVVSIGTPPVLNAAGPFCANASPANLTANISGGTWSGIGITNGALGTFTPSTSIVGFDTVTYTTNGSCPTSSSEAIEVTPIPVSDAGTDLTICSGGSGTIGTGTVAGYTYSWSPTTGITGSTTVSNPTVSLTNPGPSASTTTTYTVTTTAAGCHSTATVNVIVDAVATVNAGSSQHVCPGATIQLAGSIGGSATSGTWSGGSGSFSPNNTTLNAIYTPSAAEYAADSVILTLTTNDPAGPCTFSSSNVIFYFYYKPVVLFSVDNPNGCPPQHCANFKDSSTVAGGDYVVSRVWTFGDGSPTSTLASPSHCYSQTGYYDVTLTVTSNHGCTSTLTQQHFIHIFANPIAAFTPNPNPASVLDASVTLYNQSSTDVISWYWNFGDGTTLPWTSNANPDHIYPHDSASNFIATLIVKNTDGCYDTVAHEIIINPEFSFFIPNAFTPNGDGINDYFYGSGVGIINYDLWIFDRWGNTIFHGLNLNDKWNGKANNGSDLAQIDVYIWKVRLMDIFNKTHNYIGTVTLVK